MKKSTQLLRYCVLGIFAVILITSSIFRVYLPKHYHRSHNVLSSETIVGDGNIITKKIPIGQFEIVNVNGKFNLVINNDENNTCSLTTDKNIIPKVIISTNNNILNINTSDEISVHPEIIISSKTVNQINIGGKSKVRAKNISSDHLNVVMSGKSSGDIQGNIKNAAFNLNGKSELYVTLPHADHINININGKGTIYLTGETKMLTIVSLGKVNISAKHMQATDVIIESAGESTMLIHPSRSLTVRAFGRSYIQYLGEPTITKNIFGDSTLKKFDNFFNVLSRVLKGTALFLFSNSFLAYNRQ